MKYAVAETRRILRDRFARYLPVIQYAAAAPRGGNLIPDEQLLELLLGLDIVCKSDIDSSRAAYDAASPPGIGEPSLDEVIAAGWIRVVWGRIAAPFEIDQRARARPDDNLTALSALLKERFGETYAFSGAAYGDVGLESLAAAIERGDASPGALRSQSPEWVAARLGIARCPPLHTAARFASGWIDGAFWAGLCWSRTRPGARRQPMPFGRQRCQCLPRSLTQSSKNISNARVHLFRKRREYRCRMTLTMIRLRRPC